MPIILTLYMLAGAGKTYLTSKVIDFVIDSIKEYGESHEAVAYFYCKRDEDNRRNPWDILQSILRQLTSDLISDECKVHSRLKGLPDELERKGKTFDFLTCKILIEEIIQDYSRTTIILDALDECDRESREELMIVFDELMEGNSSIRILLSSRTDDDIRRHFQSRPVIEIQTTDNEDDTAIFVQDRLSRDRRWDGLEPSLRNEIKEVFRQQSQGMFQSAALQIQQLKKLSVWSKSNISKHLEIAPKGLEAAYDIVWEQIQDMPRGQVHMARLAFLWVLCAFRPLHTRELSLAMQLDASSNGTIPDDTLDKGNILNIRGNLLTYVSYGESKLEYWRFCHLSVREYVENKDQYDIRSAHYNVAISSLKFAVENDIYDLWNPSWPPSLLWRQNYKRPPFSYLRGKYVPVHRKPVGSLSYILVEALNHARVADSPQAKDSELGCIVKQFLGSVESGSSTFRNWQDIRGNLNTSPKWSRPLEAMAAFGLFHMLQDWWQIVISFPGVLRPERPSILSLAIKYDHEPIWWFLAQSNHAINAGYPPRLIAAIEANSLPAFEALIDAEADVNQIDRSPYRNNLLFQERLGIDTPLKAAICAASYDLRGRWSTLQ